VSSIGLSLSENEIQRAVFAHIRERGAPGLVAFHPKNGGIHQRGRARGINAGLGVRSGVSDVILFRDGRFFVLELKREGKKVKDGDEQDRFLADVRAAGGEAEWCAGLDAAIAQLETWGLLIGRAR
jgi:hypothetical protein